MTEKVLRQMSQISVRAEAVYLLFYEGFPVITTLARKMCDRIVTPPFHFDHLPTQVPKSPHCSQNSESSKILANFFRG